MMVLIKSMTGFGVGQFSDETLNITVEIKSVNHRYFELSTRIPRGYAFLEEHIKNLIKEKINRGKIDVYLSFDGIKHLENIEINEEVADAYVKALINLKEKYDLMDDISVSLVAKYPDVLVSSKCDLEEEFIVQSVSKAMDLALNQLITMREKEGQKLKDDICSRLTLICSIMENIENKIPEILENYKERLIQNINTLINDDKLKSDENRILTEVAIFADKIAIDEEIVRIKSHISQLKIQLESNKETGRKMDFIVQELNREINTIGSKVQDIDVSKLVIEVKSQLEKIREQVQNIE